MEPSSFTHVKNEHDAPAPPSSKKVRHLAKDATCQLDYQAPDDPEECPGKRAVECASFNEVQPGTLEFTLAWSRQDVERAASASTWRRRTCLSLKLSISLLRFSPPADQQGLSESQTLNFPFKMLYIPNPSLLAQPPSRHCRLAGGPPPRLHHATARSVQHLLHVACATHC
jgi:hypothetical protein